MDTDLPKAPFPAPPPFWKHFTTANLEKLKETEASDSNTSTQPLPLELTFLRPPPPPPSDTETYPTFNQPNFISIKPVLPPDELLLFDPSRLENASQRNNPREHAVLLMRLTKSLLLNFLELTTLLSEAPTEYEEKMEDIRRLMVNVHAVVNMYRPHQARENVKEMLEGMLVEGKKEVEECDRKKEEIGRFLGEVKGWQGRGGDEMEGVIHRIGHDDQTDRTSDAEKSDERLKEAERLWRLMDEIGNE